MHFLDSLIEVCALITDLLREQSGFRRRLEARHHHGHQRIRCSFLIPCTAILAQHDIDLDRAVKNRRQLCGKPLRDRQIGQ